MKLDQTGKGASRSPKSVAIHISFHLKTFFSLQDLFLLSKNFRNPHLTLWPGRKALFRQEWDPYMFPPLCKPRLSSVSRRAAAAILPVALLCRERFPPPCAHSTALLEQKEGKGRDYLERFPFSSTHLCKHTEGVGWGGAGRQGFADPLQ